MDGGSSVTHAYEASYDDVGHMTSRTEIDRTNGSNVYTTTYGYDSRGNLVWQVNAEGNPTRFTFDGLGRMTKKEVALGSAARSRRSRPRSTRSGGSTRTTGS